MYARLLLPTLALALLAGCPSTQPSVLPGPVMPEVAGTWYFHEGLTPLRLQLQTEGASVSGTVELPRAVAPGVVPVGTVTGEVRSGGELSLVLAQDALVGEESFRLVGLASGQSLEGTGSYINAFHVPARTCRLSRARPDGWWAEYPVQALAWYRTQSLFLDPEHVPGTGSIASDRWQDVGIARVAAVETAEQATPSASAYCFALPGFFPSYGLWTMPTVGQATPGPDLEITLTSPTDGIEIWGVGTLPRIRVFGVDDHELDDVRDMGGSVGDAYSRALRGPSMMRFRFSGPNDGSPSYLTGLRYRLRD